METISKMVQRCNYASLGEGLAGDSWIAAHMVLDSGYQSYAAKQTVRKGIPIY